MLILIVVLVYAVWRGWCTGLITQLAGLLGMGFGVVAARLFNQPVAEWLVREWPKLDEGFAHEYKVKILAVTVVFCAVYLAFSLLGTVLRSALSLLHAGALNAIAGAGVSLLKWVVIMSVIYNMILALFPSGTLAGYCDDGDGNLVELVMGVAPALMDTACPDDLEHTRKLEEARKISENGSGVYPCGRRCVMINESKDLKNICLT